MLSDYYYDGLGEDLKVVQNIRPMLEEYYRLLRTDLLGPNEWLGDLVGKVRDAEPGDSAHDLKSLFTQLEDVIDYSKTFHNAGKPTSPKSPINNAQLRVHVKKALGLVGVV